jgi:hypothetical protein
MTLEATYIIDADEKQIPETDLATPAPELWDEIRALDPVYGRIRITRLDDPAFQLEMEDELWYLVLNVCFLSIPELVAYKNVVIKHYAYFGYLRMDPEGGSIRISGDNIPTTVLPESETLRAAFQCGKRFVQFARQMGITDPTAGEGQAAFDAAEDALRRRGIIT